MYGNGRIDVDGEAEAVKKKWIGVLALVLAVALGGIPAFAGIDDPWGISIRKRTVSGSTFWP